MFKSDQHVDRRRQRPEIAAGFVCACAEFAASVDQTWLRRARDYNSNRAWTFRRLAATKTCAAESRPWIVWCWAEYSLLSIPNTVLVR